MKKDQLAVDDLAIDQPLAGDERRQIKVEGLSLIDYLQMMMMIHWFDAEWVMDGEEGKKRENWVIFEL